MRVSNSLCLPPEKLFISRWDLVHLNWCFGHTVKGPLKIRKGKWLCVDTDINLLDYVFDFKEKLKNVCEIVKENLKKSQSKVKK